MDFLREIQQELNELKENMEEEYHPPSELLKLKDTKKEVEDMERIECEHIVINKEILQCQNLCGDDKINCSLGLCWSCDVEMSD